MNKTHPQPEMVILVDENDQVLGQEEKLRAHELGLLHRAFSVFLFRKNGPQTELLLQQRHPLKYHAGGLWSNSCCSHPRLGEDIVAAGERRLREELGIQAELEAVGRFQYRAEFPNGLIEHELDYLLIGWDDGLEFTPNPLEVSNTRWQELGSLQQELDEYPERFTPWFGEALGLVCQP